MKHGPTNRPRTAAFPHQKLQNKLSQAVTLHQAGDIQQAQSLYLKILNEDPEHAEALHMMGIIALQVGRFDLAEKFISHALKNNGKIAAAHNNLGNALRGQGKLEEAIQHFRQALKLNPSFPDALNNLGTILLEQGKLEQAADQFHQALRLKPDYPTALINLGNALYQQDKLEAAVDAYRQALHLNPKASGCLCNLGTVLQDLARPDEAINVFNEAMRIDPANFQALNGLGIAYRSKGMAREAIEHFENLLRNSPDYAEAHYNYSLALLQAGKIAQGWAEYEWRMKQGDAAARRRGFPQPWWNGEELIGKTLLIWGEQGVGDEIFFANAIPDAIEAAHHCLIECDRRLVTLFARSFPKAEVVPRSDPPAPRLLESDIDYQAPIGNLCRWFRDSLEKFPIHYGYLSAEPERAAFWKQRISNLGEGIKVGICWRSGLRSAGRKVCYSNLSQWKAIFAIQGIIFVNLQYDDCEEVLLEAETTFNTTIYRWPDLDLKNDFENVAALMSALDLVISAPTSVGALAGALGITTWELLPDKVEWPMLGTNYMPWQPPSARVFTKPLDTGWEMPIEEIAHELASLTSRQTFNLCSECGPTTGNL